MAPAGRLADSVSSEIGCVRAFVFEPALRLCEGRDNINSVERKMNMDRTTPLSTTPTNIGPKIENVAQTAHKVVDTVADKTTAQVDRLSSTAHRAVDKTAGAATQAAGWASSLPDQAKEVQTRLTDSVCTSIRARPITTVAGALVVGYLLGRIARL